MDQELQKLIRQLQDKKCPPTVLDRVAQRISREKTSAGPWRAALAWGLSIFCLLGLIGLWRGQTRREAKRVAVELATARTRANRALVVHQTQEAFGYIGQALMRAAAQTENALLKEAVPPLRNGFETVKNKVTNPI